MYKLASVTVLPIPDRVLCPKCGARNAIVTGTRFGVKSFYCFDCDHGWSDRLAPSPPDTSSNH
jgi:transposase-like protein